MSKKRKWNDNNVRFDFNFHRKSDDLQKPHCMIYENVLSKANLKQFMLQEYLDMAGPMSWASMKNLCELKEPVLISQVTLSRFVSVKKTLLMASYQLMFKVAKSTKSHTIAEELKWLQLFLEMKQERSVN